MAQILQQNILGNPLAEPIILDRRRRRLSSVVKRHAKPGRPFFVNVRKVDDPPALEEGNDKLRAQWAHTLISSDDVVAIVYLPLGGSANAGAAGTSTAGATSGGSTGKSIGRAIGMVAIAVAATVLLGPAGPLMGALAGAGVTGIAATATSAILTAGVVAGAGYLIQRATQSKANKPGQDAQEDRPVYGVSGGGGNLPRPGDRIPRGYGVFWINPDLSQPDYSVYEGEDQVLFKRMVVGVGRYRVLEVQVGGVTLWTEGEGIHAPFIGAQIEVIQPGFPSGLVPDCVFSSGDVSGIELPRPADIPDSSGPWPGTPPGIQAGTFQIDFSLPQGAYTGAQQSGTGLQSAFWSISVEYATCDEEDNPTGPWQLAYVATEAAATSRAIRRTAYISLSVGRYLFRARNGMAEQPNVINTIMWDGLRAHIAGNIYRPHVTEVALRVRSGKALGITAFGQIMVRASAIIPANFGGGWTYIETAKAAWAYADILRGFEGGVTYGAALPDSFMDMGQIVHYASGVGAPYDEFNGVIRGPVSVFEAAQTVLGAMRAEPLRIGNAWSVTRDESRNVRKHLFTRRQIMRGSSNVSFAVGRTDGSSDVVAEYYFQGDPRRRREVRATFGTLSSTPRRVNLVGVTNHAHAGHLATWMAASAYYRRQRRKFTAELQGRLVKRNDPAFVDVWFLNNVRGAGVISRAPGNVLTLDCDMPVSGDTHAVFRDREGLDFGPINVIQGATVRELILDGGDLAALEEAYGIPFWQDLMAVGTEMPTPIMIGSIAEMREPYLIQRADHRARDQVQIEALHDHPNVWLALGEVPIDPGTSATGDQMVDLPEIGYISAHAVQHSTALNLEWAVGRVRGAAAIIVDLSYDDTFANIERISSGLSETGVWPLRTPQSNDELPLGHVRAYAVSAYGVPGPAKVASFTIWKPFITAEWANLIIRIEDLAEQVKRDIEKISKVGEATIQGALKDLDSRINKLASAQATTDAQTYEADRYVKVVSANSAYSAIHEEERTRIDQDEVLAEQITTIGVELGDTQAALSTEISVRADADSAEALARTTLEAAHTQTRAILVQEQQVRADGDTALAQSVTALSTTVSGHTFTISQVTQSLNGTGGYWGVAMAADGLAIGGFRLAGFRNMDGTFSSQFGIYGDLVVTGTISGPKLESINIITVSAQIGDLIVDNIHVKNQAITQGFIATGSGTASNILTTRGTGHLAIIAFFYGQSGTYVPLGSATGTLALRIDGVLYDSIGMNYEASGTGTSAGFARQQTMIVSEAFLTPGTHIITALVDVGGPVRVYVAELSK
jgi:hypothetical protein